MSGNKTYPLLPVIRRSPGLKAAPAAVGWGDRGAGAHAIPMVRARVGLSFDAVLQPQGVRVASNNILMRNLTPDDYQHAYMRCPDVRSSVDSIVRIVSTADWTVASTLDPSDKRNTEALEIASAAQAFLKQPDKNGETWQSMTTAFLTNLLIQDAAVLEKVFDGKGAIRKSGKGDLAEIVARPGETFIPEIDKHGTIIRWYQDFGARLVPTPTLTRTDVPTFDPDHLLYMRLFANTRHPVYGTPVLESLIEEIVSMMRAAQNIMQTFDVDEIPPGILVLAGMDSKTGGKALSDLKSYRGRDHVLRVLTTHPQARAQPQWIEFKRSLKEIDMSGLIKEIRRTIWRTFGVHPIVQGDTEAMPRATAETQLDASESHLVVPIKEQFAALINARILPAVVGDPKKAAMVQFQWQEERDLSTSEEEERGRTLTGYVKDGVLTRNEARERIGVPPIEGGDIPTVVSGGRVLALSEVLKQSADDTTDPDDDPDPDDDGVSAEDAEADAPTEAEASSLPIGQPSSPPAPGRSDASTEERAPKKYDHINFTPPKGVQKECERGLKWVKEGHGGKGLTDKAKRWARKLANGDDITPQKARDMKGWIARHEPDRDAEGFKSGEDGYPSPGRVAHSIWGWKASEAWCHKLVNQMEKADEEEEKKSAADPAEEQVRASEEQVRGWLVEHFSGKRRLTASRIKALERTRQEGHLLRLLQPTGSTFAHRGIQVKRPTLARLLGSAGGVSSMRSGVLDVLDPEDIPECGRVFLSGSGMDVEGRSLSSTSPDRDKWWSLSPMRAAQYARGEVRQHMGESDPDRWYAVVLSVQLDDQRFLLNPANLATEPGIGDALSDDEAGEALRAIILEDMEVVTLSSTTPLRLVYARGDSLDDLDALLST